MTEPRERYELDVDEPEFVEPVQPKAARTVRGTVVLSARVAAGVVGAMIAAATLGATVLVPLPTASVHPPALKVLPVAAEQLRVCAPGLLRLGDESGSQATSASALGNPSLEYASSAGSAEATSIETTDEVSGRGSEIVTLAAGSYGAETLLGASVSQQSDVGEFVGLAAAECREPSDDIWLVGGATTTGRTTLLTVANPGEVAATVDITVYSDSGAIRAPGASGIAIAPHSERIFSLAGLAPDVAAPVVRVQSTGALVAASLQQSVVRTLAPGGIDFVGATTGPSRDAVIPGIVFPDHEALEQATVGEDYLDLRAAVRVFVPGDTAGHAVVTMTPANGVGEGVGVKVLLPAGRVTELPVGDFEAGTYVATITADVDFVAGARTAAVGTAGANDFTWLPAVEPVRDSALVAVANGPGATLHLANPTADALEVSIVSEEGVSTTAKVSARGATTVAVTAGTSYTLSGFDQLMVTVGFVGDGVIASHAVSPRAPGSTPITIYP